MQGDSVERTRFRAVCALFVALTMFLAASTATKCEPSQASVPKTSGSGTSSGTSLAGAHLSQSLRLKIERDLDWQAMTEDDRTETERASTVYDLSFPAASGQQARHVVQISGGGPPCGRANCPELLYDEVSGARLFNAVGYNFVFLKTSHAGAPDLQIDDSVGPDQLFRTVYFFDGSVYRQLRHVKYCCGN
jgi:hypothetical protein